MTERWWDFILVSSGVDIGYLQAWTPEAGVMNLPAASGRGILTELIFHSPQVAGNLPIEIKLK